MASLLRAVTRSVVGGVSNLQLLILHLLNLVSVGDDACDCSGRLQEVYLDHEVCLTRTKTVEITPRFCSHICKICKRKGSSFDKNVIRR